MREMTPDEAAAVLLQRLQVMVVTDAMKSHGRAELQLKDRADEAALVVLSELERRGAEIKTLRGRLAGHKLWGKSLSLRVERLKKEIPDVVGDIDTTRPTKAAFIAMGRMQNRLAERGEPVDYSSRSPVSIEDICALNPEQPEVGYG